MRKHRNRFSFRDQLTPKGGLLRSAMTFVEAHACLVRSQEPQKHFDHGAPVSMIIEELNKGYQGYQRSSSFKEKIMRFIILLLVSLFAAFLWCEENDKRPPQVEEALDKYYAAISKEKQKYLEAAYKIQQKTKVVLEAELKTRTQKGDLDGALGVKAVLAELQKELVTDDPLFGYLPAGLFDSITNKNLPIELKMKKALLEYNWVGEGFTFIFSEDGTYAQNSSKPTGTYRFENGLLILTVSAVRFSETWKYQDQMFVVVSKSDRSRAGQTFSASPKTPLKGK